MSLPVSWKVLLVLGGPVHVAGLALNCLLICWPWLGQLGPHGSGRHVSHPPAGWPRHFHLVMTEEESRQAQLCTHFSSLCLTHISGHPIGQSKSCHWAQNQDSAQFHDPRPGEREGQRIGALNAIKLPHLSPTFFASQKKCQNKMKFQNQKVFG